VKTIGLYVCEGCGSEYRKREDAQACETRARNAAASFKVGDIVTARAGFGWYDGDRSWITNATKVDPHKRGKPGPIARRECPNGHGNCFSECCTFSFYYVITHIDADDFNNEARKLHRVRYHLATNAMKAKNGYHSGYTFDMGHFTPTLVEKPPTLVRLASRALIGKKATSLL
jgi:hypothetical protein